jgi:hypothetical protein
MLDSKGLLYDQLFRNVAAYLLELLARVRVEILMIALLQIGALS